MTDIVISCSSARPDTSAAMPTLLLDLDLTENTGTRVFAMLLRAQVRIEPVRRQYAPDEVERLQDLFGESARWGETLKPMQLSTVSFAVPGFTGSTRVALPIPCSYDLEVATGRYLQALRGGEVPLLLLFSGTVFFHGGDGVQVEPVPWDREATYRLPISVWRDVMDLYFPGEGWLRLRTDTIDALARFKSRQALPTWDDTVARLLKQAGEDA